MSIFQTTNDNYFKLAEWEDDKRFFESKKKGGADFFEKVQDDTEKNQFILLQLVDGDQRVQSTTQVEPKLAGSSDKPDINMLLDFEGFKIGSNEGIDPKTKATLQLQVGQEEKKSGLDKLFYCINGGLDLYNEIKKKKSDAKDFKKSTAEALGNQPISLPASVGQISLKVVKHQEPKWWQKVFSFVTSGAGKELISLIGFPGITEVALNSISGMLDNLFDKEPDILFQSKPIKLAFTKSAKDELQGGLTSNVVSCLNPGLWIMARATDYDMIVNSKPIYYSGFGILAPEGMSDIEALKDAGNNPFSKITYAVIKAKMKEVEIPSFP